MKVGEIMTKEVICVSKNDDLSYVMSLMEKHNITKLPVVDNGRIMGIVTDNKIADKLGRIRSRGVPPARMHASTVMEKKFDKISPDMDLVEILKTVGEPGPTMLPVLVGENLVGVVTKADVLPLVKSEEDIKEIMSTNVITVKPEERVIHARRLMIDNNIARLPVVEDRKVVGMVSDKEIAFAFANLKKNVSLRHQNNRIRNMIVRDIMKSPAITARDNISIKECAGIMIENEIGCLPIVGGDGKIKGIVTRTDLLKHLLKELEEG